MDNSKLIQVYKKALKLGKLSYSKEKTTGQNGYLPALEAFVDNSSIISESYIGLIEIPLKKIKGTYTFSRAKTFAKNFMPLLNVETEFGNKWLNLYNSHEKEGIRDPIKVYEYLNWFYVVEGNKRVSVLKYMDAYSISAYVTRLIPKYDENNPLIRTYYKFIEFNKKTGLNWIWMSDEKNFDELQVYLNNYNPKLKIYEDKYTHFQSYVFNAFRETYIKAGGKELDITTGDAFLQYIKIYGIPNKFDLSDNLNLIKNFIIELKAKTNNEPIQIHSDLIQKPKKNIITSLATLVTNKKKLKAAFVYKKSIQNCGWTYAHERGRLHIEKVLGDRLSTTYIENVPENMDAYNHIKSLAEEGHDIIFTTDPIFKKATLKAALNYPDIKFLNCSDSHPFQHVMMYYGKLYEPKFLIGILAGVLTKTNVIGYSASYPLREIITEINAFALGAQMVNPRAKIKVLWTYKENEPKDLKCINQKLSKANVDIIFYHDLPAPESHAFQYGLCSINLGAETHENFLFSHFANLLLDFGTFYEKFLKLILNGENKTVFDIWNSNSQLINYWLGMDSEIVDIVYSNRYVPKKTQMLIEAFKKMIVQKQFHPFTGPIYDQNDNLRIKDGEIANYQQLISMNWFVDGIDGEIPEIYNYEEDDFKNRSFILKD
ncbi:BMP family ABC transporter substrate-binding protein [Clostridium aestuarii]|uniref:BMP family ABC transporter substrate-binding protein n=1 Tax=Clostridium aestuarii TaxID=338193 RepID=A0ABT4CYN8_9CLOT|nr:BMP family ABC transporter substrate-binding protein [Clostridium aestuarii]MCY6482933.1 BMP family ABC transporter substrate-binding protein [Clostridium aestuarii]